MEGSSGRPAPAKNAGNAGHGGPARGCGVRRTVQRMNSFFTVRSNDINGLAASCHNRYTLIPVWVGRHRREAEPCADDSSSNINWLAAAAADPEGELQ